MPAFCLLLFYSYYSNNFAGKIDASLLHSPSNMWQAKVFVDSSLSSSDLDSTELPHPKRKRSAHVALQDTTIGKRKALLKGKKKKWHKV